MGPASQEVLGIEPMRSAKSGSPSTGRCIDSSASPERLFVVSGIVSSFGTVLSLPVGPAVRLDRRSPVDRPAAEERLEPRLGRRLGGECRVATARPTARISLFGNSLRTGG